MGDDEVDSRPEMHEVLKVDAGTDEIQTVAIAEETLARGYAER